MTDTTHGRPMAEQRIREAQAERDAGTSTAENAADPRVVLMIDAAIERAIESGRRFSANDIRDQFPVANEGLVGARIRSYAVRRADGHPLMVPVGRTPSTLKSTHAHEIKVWLGWEAHRAVNNRAASAAS